MKNFPICKVQNFIILHPLAYLTKVRIEEETFLQYSGLLSHQCDFSKDFIKHSPRLLYDLM
jgi:hypothetical protein